MVYCLRHRASGRVYVGSTVDLQARLRAHRREPPRRMREDAGAGPFDSLFEVEVLERCQTEAHAHHLEEQHIERFAACGVGRYNNLKGTPARSKKYFVLKKNGKIKLS